MPVSICPALSFRAESVRLRRRFLLYIPAPAGLSLIHISSEAAPAGNADFDHTSAIAVYSREDGSGTRGAFIELFGVEEKDESGEKVDNTTEEAIITNSTDVMLTSVAGDTYAIGYVSLGLSLIHS